MQYKILMAINLTRNVVTRLDRIPILMFSSVVENHAVVVENN